MTFDEILLQILEVLKTQGRISYGAIKRRYAIDDAYLDDLKDEIVYAQRLAMDEDGRILVWTGDPLGTDERAALPAQPSPQFPRQHDQAAQIAPPPTTTQLPEAERRQLTVMFCDLVDSTTLSSHLDPEDLRDVVRAYQKVCSEVIQRYEGHIAQLLGDGLLVYFGYPHAHEDDAQRAIHTGLGILAALDDLNTVLQRDHGCHLAVRLGVHTGLVVVGEMGGAGRQEQLALGETPNIAARIEGLASPNTLVLSAATWRLVQDYFTGEPLGAQTLKGVTHPMPVYRVVGPRGAQSRVESTTRRGLTPLVGREQEVGVLLERWAQVQDGHGQVVVLSGEAGIGKSRLLQVLDEHLADTAHTRRVCRSSPYYHDSALYPLIDLLQRALDAQPPDGTQAPHVALAQLLEPYHLATVDTVPLLARLLSIPVPDGHYPSLTGWPQQQRQRTLKALRDFVLPHEAQQPVLFILEDLHWADPSTLEWLTLLIAQVPTLPLLMLLTCRPEFPSPWGNRSYLTPLVL